MFLPNFPRPWLDMTHHGHDPSIRGNQITVVCRYRCWVFNEWHTGYCHRCKSGSFVMLLPVLTSKQPSCWRCRNPHPNPSNVSPFGLLIRSNHTVAHTSELLYLHLNHLITPLSISPHNWMNGRNRAVTLACPTIISFLTSVLATVVMKEAPAFVLNELRLVSQPIQRKGETGTKFWMKLLHAHSMHMTPVLCSCK